MSNEAIAILNALCEKIGIAVDWSSEIVVPEIMDVLNRYGHYLLLDGIHTLIWGVLSIAFGIFLLKATYRSYENATWAADIKKTYNWNDAVEIHKSCSGLGMAGYIVSAVFLFLGLCNLVFGIDGILTAVTIPDIYAAQKIIAMIQECG